MKREDVEVTEHTTTVQLTAEDIRKCCGAAPNAVVSVRVPGGGDWSNTTLELGADIEHIEVSWRYKTTPKVSNS